MSKQLGITTRWFSERYKNRKITGEVPIKRYKLGRPIKVIPKKEVEIIVKKYEENSQKLIQDVIEEVWLH